MTRSPPTIHRGPTYRPSTSRPLPTPPSAHSPARAPAIYAMDVDEMKKYLEASSSDDAFQDYLATEVFAFSDHESYCRARGLGVEIPAAVG